MYSFWCRCGMLEIETSTFMGVDPKIRCLICNSAPIKFEKPGPWPLRWIEVKYIFGKPSTICCMAGGAWVAPAMLYNNLTFALIGLAFVMAGTILSVVFRR